MINTAVRCAIKSKNLQVGGYGTLNARKHPDVVQTRYKRPTVEKKRRYVHQCATAALTMPALLQAIRRDAHQVVDVVSKSHLHFIRLVFTARTAFNGQMLTASVSASHRGLFFLRRTVVPVATFILNPNDAVTHLVELNALYPVIAGVEDPRVRSLKALLNAMDRTSQFHLVNPPSVGGLGWVVRLQVIQSPTADIPHQLDGAGTGRVRVGSGELGDAGLSVLVTLGIDAGAELLNGEQMAATAKDMELIV